MTTNIANWNKSCLSLRNEYDRLKSAQSTAASKSATPSTTKGTLPRDGAAVELPKPPFSAGDTPSGSILNRDPARAPLSPSPAPSKPSPTPAGNSDILPQPPAGSDSNRPTAPKSFDEEGFDPDTLLPPTIEPGEPIPPPKPIMIEGLNAASTAPDVDFDLNQSRIELPAQLAGSSNGEQATITMATEKVTDRRIVELAFHPSLSRAANFDDRADDDGLYLVLRPTNERGQMVAEAAELTIVVLDPAREGNDSRIGRWDYTAAEVKAKMQPIGSTQGIHLTLPWNGPDPSADRVIVFAKYTFENGRQVIGQKEIFVSSDGGLKSVWAPRGASGSRQIASTPAVSADVVTASSTQPQETRRQTPQNIVRPATDSLPPADPPTPFRSMP